MNNGYWDCCHTELLRDAPFFLSMTMNCFSLVLNIVVLVLLFLLKGQPRMFLFHLRAMIASTVLQTFLMIIPPGFFLADSILAPFTCHVVLSHYLWFMTYTFAVLILTFTVGNRAIQIVCRYQYSHFESVINKLSYVIGFGLLSLTCLLPQVFIVQWDGQNCNCLDTDLPYGLLVSHYTGTYLRFGVTAGICTIILSISCYKIINWVRNTSPEHLKDSWNILTLPGTTNEQIKALHRPQGWFTASLCTVPLSVSFLVSGIFETGYKCICAAGFCTIRFDSPLTQTAIVLCDIHVFVLPIIIIVYIPALRALPVCVFQKLRQSRCMGGRTRTEEVQSPLP